MTIRFKQEIDLLNLKYISKVMNTNPNKLIQVIVRSYISGVMDKINKDA